MPPKPAKGLLVQEIKVADAVALFKLNKDNQGRKWSKVVTMVRDPNDLTRIIAIQMHESA